NSLYSSINILYPLENRFASYLLSVIPSYSNTITIEGVNHISELLGSSYRHLNRVIKSLVDSNIIKKNKNEIHILDIKELESLAKDIYR
ncbi:helix-turn-helix domain-containing protein, partial [Clostridium saudiense]|nr:helix-turn-helix domain-containing protein [Clostridium saudiense]